MHFVLFFLAQKRMFSKSIWNFGLVTDDLLISYRYVYKKSLGREYKEISRIRELLKHPPVVIR